MKRFKLITTVTVMAIGGLMASALPAAAAVSQQSTLGAPASKDRVSVQVVTISAEQVRTAARAHGLSSAQTEALLQHPQQLLTPTRVAFETPGGASNSTGIFNSPYGSNSVWGQESYYNVFGMRLASVRMTQQWWWSGGVVTSAPAPIISASVTSIAAAGGWSYQGVVASSTYFYDSPEVPGTNSHSGHRTYRQFKFTTCFIKFGCFQEKLPTIDIHVNANGGWNVVTHG